MVRTFSSETGEELQFEDLTDQKEALKQILRDACWELANEKQDDSSFYGYKEVVNDGSSFDSRFSEENFDWGLGDDGMHICFAPYTVIGFAGEVTFVVPYDLIADSVYDWVLPE